MREDESWRPKKPSGLHDSNDIFEVQSARLISFMQTKAC